jgi:hypothetical protein
VNLREEIDMRLEATLPDSRGQAVERLADELGLSKSQVVDEAVAIFIQAVTAVRGGRRLVAVATDVQNGPDCLITTPTLASLEWTARSEPLQVSAQALERVRALIADPPAPGAASRAAASRFKKSSRGTSAE